MEIVDEMRGRREMAEEWSAGLGMAGGVVGHGEGRE